MELVVRGVNKAKRIVKKVRKGERERGERKRERERDEGQKM
jgi:hypothetical protein